ncbi:MAG: metallophosphoesterase [Bacteroidetes bacterium]|nr:metallophosphoesterase [Bacteroidota bacterium]
MIKCFFVSDIHGKIDRYERLFNEIEKERPDIVFLGGDLLPSIAALNELSDIRSKDFVNEYLVKKFLDLKANIGDDYPEVYLIMGNDDPRSEEISFLEAENLGIWTYVHNRKINYKEYQIYGYACIPPSPFLLKDWERYDISRFVDVGCVSPTEGYRTYPVSEDEKKYSTIKNDLEKLTAEKDLSNSIFLFHAPPYQTNLDRAALDGQMIDHAPVDLHVGSIAIKRFIEIKQPFITLHGHIHESSSITGSWKQKIRKTHLFSAAFNKPDLAIVKFDMNNLSGAIRVLL